MHINDGGGAKKKKKSVKIDSPSNPMQDREPKPNSRRGMATFRGGRNTGKTVDDYKRAKEERDKKKKVTGGTKTKDKSTKPRKDKAVRKIKSKRPKTNPPKPSKSTVKTEPSKTYSTTNLLAWDNQEQELLNAYIAMAGTELFQYTNAQTIDGAYNDVAIINVLSRRRQQYTPNRIIEQAQIYVRQVWIEAGNLCLEIDDPDRIWDDCVLLLRIGSSSTTIAETVN